jgi:murein DD-endopeptidase MepM/ murein hydrolase activator NlpD
MIKRWDERVIRSDLEGDGHFAAKRGSKRHKGVDYEFSPGDEVESPVDGIVTRLGYAYANEPYRLIEILSHKGYLLWRFLYVQPKVRAGDKVESGQVIGTAQAISDKYGPNMKNHVHVEMNVDTRAMLGGKDAS